MVISQVIGRGAPELVRFWGEPPLVREPDVALFGFERLDKPEEQYLLASPLLRHPSLEVSTVGAASAARQAVERVHAAKHEFILHFDVDVINSDEFHWTNFPGAGGLSLGEVRDALRVFVSQPNLAALVVAGYNPDLDADGQGAKKLTDLLVEVISTRLETSSAAAAGTVSPADTSSAPIAVSPEIAPEALPSGAGPENEPERAAPADSPDATEPYANAS
jgi:arginase